MSQKSQHSNFTNLLNEASSWSIETRLKRIETALPLALTTLEESTLIADSIGTLKVICQSLLPCVKCESLEDKLFNKLGPAIINLTDRVLEQIHSALRDKENEAYLETKKIVTEHLECLVDIGQCVEHCVKSVLGVTVNLSWVHSLLACSVKILLQSYNHCKDSSDLYGEFLNHFSEYLSTLFKTAHSLQMSLLALLDKIFIEGSPLEEHVITLCSVCTHLYDICCIVTNLDVKLVISLLRGISRVCSQHLSLLQDRFNVSPIINYLCQQISQGFQYLLQLCTDSNSESLSDGDEKAFSKLIKVLGFQMKVMVALLRDFSNYLDNCEGSILNLLLCFHRLLPPSLSAKILTEKQTAEIKSHLVNATAPILSHLMSNKIFRIELTATRTTEIHSEDSLPKLLLQIMILDMLPKCEVNIMDRWLTPVNFRENEPTQSILAAIFHSVEMCEVEMRYPVLLPSVMVAGRPLREVSLYEHVATHLCGYIGACRVCHFNNLESTLLENVLGQSNLLSLLASDCWCFLARYGTASLCRDQVHYLLKLFLQLKDKSNSDNNKKVLFRLQCLLQRLIKLMAGDHQKDLIDIIVPEEKPEFWVMVTPDCLPESLSSTVKQRLLIWSVNVIQRSHMKVSDMFVAIDFLTYILSNSSKAAFKIDLVNQNLILNFVWKMSLYMDYAKTETQEKLVAKLLLLAKCMIQEMPTELFLQLLQLIQKKVKENISVNICISVVLFLGQFGKLKVEPNFESQVQEKCSQILREILCYCHPLVHHVVLSTFVGLLSQTVHENFITRCIKEEVWLQKRIEDFSKKKPVKSSKEVDLMYFLKSEILERYGIEKVNTSVSNNLEPVITECSDTMSPKVEPPAKRIKLNHMIKENSGEEPENISNNSSSCDQTLLQRLNSFADDLENECRKSSLTDEFIEEAKLIVMRINDCLVPSKTWFDNLA